ncbi:MAG: V-type ATP synthase subunit K [bacterium]
MSGRSRVVSVFGTFFLVALGTSICWAQGTEASGWILLGPVALAVAGAAVAVGLAGIGSAIGIGYAGQTSLGAMSEDTANFARYLMLTALPGTQGIYGFVIGFLIMLWSGIFTGDTAALTIQRGWQFFFSSLPVGLAGFLSAVHQGRVCAAGVEMTVKKPDEVGKALVLGVFVEFYAVLGFLMSIILLTRIRG